MDLPNEKFALAFRFAQAVSRYLKTVPAEKLEGTDLKLDFGPPVSLRDKSAGIDIVSVDVNEAAQTIQFKGKNYELAEREELVKEVSSTIQAYLDELHPSA